MVGDRRSDDEHLRLPHPRAAERAFVLRPWLDLDPDAELLDRGRVADLLAAVGECGDQAPRRPGPRARVSRTPPDPDDEHDEPDEPADGRAAGDRCGRRRPASSSAWGVAGLVGGWLLHPLAERVSGTAPVDLVGPAGRAAAGRA